MLDGSATLASPKREPPSHGEELAWDALRSARLIGGASRHYRELADAAWEWVQADTPGDENPSIVGIHRAKDSMS